MLREGRGIRYIYMVFGQENRGLAQSRIFCFRCDTGLYNHILSAVCLKTRGWDYILMVKCRYLLLFTRTVNVKDSIFPGGIAC